MLARFFRSFLFWLARWLFSLLALNVLSVGRPLICNNSDQEAIKAESASRQRPKEGGMQRRRKQAQCKRGIVQWSQISMTEFSACDFGSEDRCEKLVGIILDRRARVQVQ